MDCLPLQVEPTQVGPIRLPNLCLWTPAKSTWWPVRSVCPGIRPPSETCNLFQGNYLQTFAFLLWREDGSVTYSYRCYWAYPALSLSGQSPTELETISYCPIWDWVPFLSPLTTHRAIRYNWTTQPHVEAGRNTSPVVLWVVRGDTEGTQS
jgi:hypothetical protein